jgi:hypothetical protein
MNIFGNKNKALVDTITKVMAEQPAKIDEYKPKEPIQSNLVDQVVKMGAPSRFDIAKKHIKESSMPKAKKPLEHNKTVSSSAEDGSMSRASLVGKENSTHKESIDAGLQNNYAIKMPGVYMPGKKRMLETDEDPPFAGPYRTSKVHKDEFGNIIKPKNVARHLARRAMQNIIDKKKKETK